MRVLQTIYSINADLQNLQLMEHHGTRRNKYHKHVACSYQYMFSRHIFTFFVKISDVSVLILMLSFNIEIGHNVMYNVQKYVKIKVFTFSL